MDRTVKTALLYVLASLPLAAQTFPVKESPNHRYLVDQNGKPFLVMGDSPQSMIANLDPSAMGTYMADRHHLGFNAILMDALCTTYTGGNGNGADGW